MRRLLLLAIAFAATQAAAAAVDPWKALQEVRRDLGAAGDLQASFTQRYVPAGFADGDEERGTITLGLPDCLRWDYTDPYPKAYLLCGSRLHTWVRGEPQGQRLRVEPEEQPGLDLLLLTAEELALRYGATAKTAAAGRIEVTLTPAKPDARLAEATFELDPATRRPTALAYRDREGNVTRFTFGDFRRIDDPAAFTPPPSIEWREQ
jgi:outer membrane lipoprotein carrier protein